MGVDAFKSSFFWPIKVAVNSGICHRKLPYCIIEYFLLWSLYHHHFLYPRCWSVGVFSMFCLIGQDVQVTSMCWCYVFQDRNGLEQQFLWDLDSQSRHLESRAVPTVLEALDVSETMGWFHKILIKGKMFYLWHKDIIKIQGYRLS